MKKIRRDLGNSRTSLMFQHLNDRGDRRRRGRARKENLFEQIMKENVPSLVKEIDF